MRTAAWVNDSRGLAGGTEPEHDEDEEDGEEDATHVRSNDEETLASMSALSDANVNFAIDDFGVGFSAIGYLQRLPVQILKVDRSFLSHIEEDPKACSLVRSMVVMGEALGLDVVIEGVEREGQLQHVIDHAGGADPAHCGRGLTEQPPNFCSPCV